MADQRCHGSRMRLLRSLLHPRLPYSLHQYIFYFVFRLTGSYLSVWALALTLLLMAS